MKRIMAVATAAVLVVSGLAIAGDDYGKKAEMMKSMQAEMMDCKICSQMAPHMAELMPVMTMEVVTLNDGMAIMHSVTDESKVALLQEVSDKMHAAGAECMDMTDAERDEKLCAHCGEFASLMAGGAKMHSGKTEMGDMMAITSDDPAMQGKIAEMETKTREMMAMHEG